MKIFTYLFCVFICTQLSLAQDDCEEGYDYECNPLSIKNPFLESFSINNIYPNPFNPQTTIEYAIDSYSYVRVNIYNLNGVLVESLIDTYQSPGYYLISWSPSGQSSGIFIVNLISNQGSITEKLLYIK